MTSATTDISIIGKLFARTAIGKEMHLPQWNQMINDVLSLANSANALMCVYARNGAGKTTFLQMLQENTRSSMDTVLIVPASPTTGSGWLLEALLPWLSSSAREPGSAQKQLAALSESSRPILLCIDSGEAILDGHLAGDVAAMLNLADSCALKLSILICSTEAKAAVLSSDGGTASRMIYKKELPHFSQDQIYEFIANKLNQMGYTVDGFTASSRSELAKAAQGSPTMALKIFSAHLGHTLPAIEKSATAESFSVSNGSPNKKSSSIKKESKSDSAKTSRIEDLLAPSKT